MAELADPITRMGEKFTFDPDGCWRWHGYRWPNGYGAFWDGTRDVRAHRYMYERLVGPIPEGMQLDHLCRNRGCVNPTHLEPVTNQENAIRGRAQITHCPSGHEYNEENTIRYRGRRYCRACARLRMRAKREGEKA